MSYDIPYGDPEGMHRLAGALRHDADQVETAFAPIARALPETTNFRGHVANRFRERRDDLIGVARRRRDELRELASWLDAQADRLQREIDEARRRAQDEERRRQQFNLWPWHR